MEKEKSILSSKNEMMPFKSFTMYKYQLIKFVIKQKLQPFFGTNPFHNPLHNREAKLPQVA